MQGVYVGTVFRMNRCSECVNQTSCLLPQNDLKDERRRAQMAAARQVLERSTMMLLTSSKTCLRHPECPSAKENRDTVFCQMRRAMDLIHYVVKDGVLDCSESQSYSNSQVSYLYISQIGSYERQEHFSALTSLPYVKSIQKSLWRVIKSWTYEILFSRNNY